MLRLHGQRRRAAIAERAMEAQVAIDDLWRVCVAENDYVLLSDAKVLRELTRASVTVARRIAGNAEGFCADGRRGMGHGRAA